MSLLLTYSVSDNTSSIETSAFSNTKMQSIFIPDCVKTIGANAFKESSLKTIKGISGSYAHTYAINNKYTFTPVDPVTTTATITTTVSTNKKDTPSSTIASTDEKDTPSSTVASTDKKDIPSSTATSTDKPEMHYDVNGDGKINIMDILTLKKYILNASD